MYRVFADTLGSQGFVLEKEDFHHLIRVLRHKEGDAVEAVFQGMLYLTVIEEIEKERALLRPLEIVPIQEKGPYVVLYQGICKGSKMDTVVQKSVELGVARIVPVFFQRSVVRPTGKDERKRARLQEIAKAAAKQSKSLRIPRVDSFTDFASAAKQAEGQILIPYEEEEQENLQEILGALDREKPISVFIGPEGGFALEEVTRLKAKGGRSLRLGDRILRTETAGMVMLALLQYTLGGMQ